MLLEDSNLLTVATNMDHMYNHKGLQIWTTCVISKVLTAMLEKKPKELDQINFNNIFI